MDLFKLFKDPVEETLDLFYLGYRVEVRGGQPTAEQRRNRLSFQVQEGWPLDSNSVEGIREPHKWLDWVTFKIFS